MSYIWKNPGLVAALLWEHLVMAGTALLISTALALLLSVLVYHARRWRGVVMGVLGIFYTIPSIVLIVLLVPVFGLNPTSVIIALIIYTQVILVRNFTAGLDAVPAPVLDAARGMGMSAWQMWWRVQIPLALPVMIAGARIAVVVAVAIATIGAKFGAGGLGTLLFQGIAQAGRYDKIWAGALSVAALSLALNQGLLTLERVCDPTRRSAGHAERACSGS